CAIGSAGRPRGSTRSTTKVGLVCLWVSGSKVLAALRRWAAFSKAAKMCSPEVRSMTAKRFSPVSSIFLKMICRTTLLPMSSGMSVRLTRNDLVRTAARYSRTAMTIVLRMMALLGFLHLPLTLAFSPQRERGVGRAGDADKNVVQRWVRHLKMANRATRHQGRQHRLRIRSPLQTKLLSAAEVHDFGYTRESVPVYHSVLFQAHPDRVAALGLLDRL